MREGRGGVGRVCVGIVGKEGVKGGKEGRKEWMDGKCGGGGDQAGTADGKAEQLQLQKCKQ